MLMAAHRARPLEVNCISTDEEIQTHSRWVYMGMDAHPLVTQPAQGNFSSWLANRKTEIAMMD
jgi:hypothetical protein